MQQYGINQNKLATTMGVGCSKIHYWFNETQDPVAESVADIVVALEKINRQAARDFVRLYLSDITFEEDDRSDEESTD
ncbi:XRE family transcriptional regulator [Leptolyngbya sp. FACHB-1515]